MDAALLALAVILVVTSLLLALVALLALSKALGEDRGERITQRELFEAERVQAYDRWAEERRELLNAVVAKHSGEFAMQKRIDQAPDLEAHRRQMLLDSFGHGEDPLFDDETHEQITPVGMG